MLLSRLEQRVPNESSDKNARPKNTTALYRVLGADATLRGAAGRSLVADDDFNASVLLSSFGRRITRDGPAVGMPFGFDLL